MNLSGGNVFLANTGSIQDIQLHSGAFLSVSGGTATGIVQESGGRLRIAFSSSNLVSGQNEFSDFLLQNNVASGFVFYNGVTQEITSGGTLLDVVVLFGAVVNVKSGGCVSGGIVASGANLYVYEGGNASGMTVNSDGCIIVAKGIAQGIRIQQGGHVVADFNGVIEGTSGGGAFSVSATSQTQDFVVISGYSQIVNSGNTAIRTEIQTGGTQFILLGGMGEGTVIQGGFQIVSSGGSVQNTIIHSGAQTLSSGALVSDTTLYGGSQVVSRFAVADQTVIMGGCQVISYNGSALNTSVFGGSQVVYDEALAENTVIGNGGVQSVGDFDLYDSGARAKNTLILQGGIQKILVFGVADGTVVSSGGSLVVNYGSAVNVQHLQGGVLSVDLDLYVGWDEWDAWDVYHASSYSYLSGTNEKGAFSVSSGSAENLILYDHAELLVENETTANSTTVSSGGILRVSSGGTATGTIVEDGGCAMVVGSTARFVSGSIGSGGILYVSGNSVGGITMASGAEVCLDLGGIVSGISNGESFYSSCGNSTVDFIIRSGYVQRLTSGRVASRSVIESGGTMVISSGATAANIIQQSGGIISAYLSKTQPKSIWGSHESGDFYFSNGQAVNFLLNSDGFLSMGSGTVLNSSVINGGRVTLTSATASNIYVSKGSIAVGYYGGSGGVLRNTIIEVGGSAYIYPNNVVGGTVLIQGLLYVYEGGQAESGTTITISVTDQHPSNQTYIYGFSNATGATISIDASLGLNGLYLLATGVSSQISELAFSVAGTGMGTLAPGQSIFDNKTKYTLTQTGTSLYLEVVSDIAFESVQLFSGESVTNCGPVAEGKEIVVGERLVVYSNGQVKNTTIDFGGLLTVSSGGYANGIEVLNGGEVLLDIGGRATGTTVQSGGALDVSSAAVVSGLTLGGSASVESGGVVSQAGILPGGELTLDAGAELNGMITVAGRMTASGPVNALGTVICLDLSSRDSGSIALVNNLALFEEACVTIHVEEGQTGIYQIADTLSGTLDGIILEGTAISLTTENYSYNGDYRYLLTGDSNGLSLEVKFVETDFAVSNLTVSELVSGDNSVFRWTLSNHDERPIAGVRQVLYVVDADNPEHRTLLKSVYLADLPENGAAIEQTAQVAWNDYLGYTNSLFQVILEADGDTNLANNTETTPSQYHIPKRLLLENLPDTVEENAGRIRVVARRTGSPDSATTVAIAIDDSTGLLSAPERVTFGVGESEKVFYITVGDNSLYQGNQNVSIQLQADGYQPCSQEITLLDNEIPTLSFEVVTTEVTEGESWSQFGKVKIDHTLTEDLTVKLSYDKKQISGVPDYVVIRAGETEVNFPLTVINDQVSEITKEIKIRATADDANAGSVTLTVLDNDLPAIALSIDKTTVSERDGVYALVGTITRTDDSTNYVKVKFTYVDKAGLSLPSLVTLGTGAQSVNFYIGITDNSLVDGDRTATVKASIFIDDCGCTVQPVSGETQVSFTILDNDGPALGLAFSKANVAEGQANAATLTLTRNTTDNPELTVHLNVNGTSLLELPETVTFAEGETSVSISVSTLTDSINTGNQLAVVTASADNYASAVGYLNITDINLPDFVISNVSVESPQIYAGKQAQVKLTLSNAGLLDFTGAVKIKLSLSDGTEFGTFIVNRSFTAGDEQEVSFNITMPDVTGHHFITATVDPAHLIKELQENNNVGITDIFNVNLGFSVTAVASL